MTDNYTRPPISEIAFGVFFEPLQNFKAPHFGLFWSSLVEEYPFCDHAAPNSRSRSSSANIEEADYLLPQCILSTSNYEYAIRFQKNSFFVYWNKVDLSPIYPFYAAVFKKFQILLTQFGDFLNKHDIGPIKAEEYRLEYENEIEVSAEINDPTKIESAVIEWKWGRNADTKFQQPYAVYWQSLYKFKDNESGTLHITTRNDVRASDKAEIFIMELNATSLNIDSTMSDLNNWFNNAHSECTNAFSELTNTEMQTSIWGKTK